MVLDSSDTRWILHPDERQRLLKGAGSLNAFAMPVVKSHLQTRDRLSLTDY